jgi:prepilin-type N-terminal cleavage/methylation domain-containing protein
MKKFTLIELLVVVAILGILLTILLPSLTNARHKAKLALCLSNLNQNGKSMMIYANNNNYKYPERKVLTDRWSVMGPTVDEREFLSEVYGNLDESFSCPVTKKNHPIMDSTVTRQLFVSYDSYAGTVLTLPGTEMYSVYDEPEVGGHTIKVLMGDFFRYSNRWNRTAHPAQGFQFGYSEGPDWGLSGYGNRRDGAFSKLDRNFLYKDGSARIFKNISGSTGIVDSRFIDIDNQIRGQNTAWRSFVPIVD